MSNGKFLVKCEGGEADLIVKFIIPIPKSM
jgi:hypothetical protein